MKLPNGSCVCCGGVGYTDGGKPIRHINAHRLNGEKRVRLYRFQGNGKGAAGRLVLLVCAYCVKSLLNIQSGQLPILLFEEGPVRPGDTKRLRGYWRKRLVRERLEATR